MIIKQEFESLKDLRGTNKINLQEINDMADDMVTRWKDTIATRDFNSQYRLMPPLSINTQLSTDNDVDVAIQTENGIETHDISEYAFGQMCSKAGVPAAYIRKCLSHNKRQLAIDNFTEWASEEAFYDQTFKVRLYDGVIRAVLTDRYNVFDSAQVLHHIRKAVDDPNRRNRYEANQVHLSPDRLHVRFVDFENPIHTAGDTLHPGFTISSSDVGSGSLNIKYFLYRFACKNGLVYIKNGGTLFRQTHVSDFNSVGAELFAQALDKIDDLKEGISAHIENAANKALNEQEFEFWIEKARKELHLGQSGTESLRNIIDTSYDHTLWGVINGVTERAQILTLTDRMDQETWAGNILAAA